MPTTEVLIPKKAFLPIYQHLLDSDADINFLWGGRDSGKSHFIAQRLVLKCLNAKFFRCVLIKETYESIKDAQWQTIKDVVEDWGLDELFNFKSSPLEIECVNGNRFIARGCDNPAKLKSIKDPTDAWYEEGNQISAEDFIVISTTLRSNKVKVQQWFSFNPECKGNYEDFWLYRQYFKAHYEKGVTNFTDTTYWKNPLTGKDIPITYTSTHTTYVNNKWVSSQRIALLEQLKETNPYYYLVFTKGQWGNKQNERPFAFAFSRSKHLGNVARNWKLPLVASFDFNRDPITCHVGQVLGPMKFRGIEQIKLPQSNIYSLCEYLQAAYPNALWEITGDATGQASSALVKDKLNYYTVIRQQLGLSPTQFKVPKVNPPIEENQVLVNAVLQLVDCQFDAEKCKDLTFDFENVSILPTGKIDKSNRKDPTQQADCLDTFRYLANVYFKHILKEVQVKKK